MSVSHFPDGSSLVITFGDHCKSRKPKRTEPPIVELQRSSPSWRLGNGFSYYGDRDEKYMGWFPAVPAGTTKLTLTHRGETRELTGRGYHDHNWGNAPELQILHHWYWGRAYVQDYALITYDMTAAKAYGYQHLPMFMLARDDLILADDPSKVAVTLSDLYVDDRSKPVYGMLVYVYDNKYRITYQREETIEAMRMLDALQDPVLRKSVEANGFDGTYLRFTGLLTIEEIGRPSSSVSGQVIWGLMYFGTPGDRGCSDEGAMFVLFPKIANMASGPTAFRFFRCDASLPS